MSTNFPGSLDDNITLPNPGAGNFTNAPSHAGEHTNENDAIKAIQTKVGIGASTPSSGKVFRGTGTGLSSWGALDLTTDVTGVLPVASGGTGITALATGIATFLGVSSSANLAAAVTDETGSGSLVFGTSPTLVTPTIASFTNAQHNHSNAAGGGQIANSGISGVGTEKLTDPYKFSVYRTTAMADGNGTYILVPFDTKEFDTGTNVDVVTKKGRFTVPLTGYYHIVWFVSKGVGSGSAGLTYLYKNGAAYWKGSETIQGGAGGLTSVGSAFFAATAGDYFEIFTYGNGGAVTTGTSGNRFAGYLVSAF